MGLWSYSMARRTQCRPECIERRDEGHALQLEINAALLMTTGRDEFIAHISRAGMPEKADENIGRLRACLRRSCPTHGDPGHPAPLVSGAILAEPKR
jgi:hypothetical protein